MKFEFAKSLDDADRFAAVLYHYRIFLLSIDTNFEFSFAKIAKIIKKLDIIKKPKRLLKVSEPNCTYKHNSRAPGSFHVQKVQPIAVKKSSQKKLA